MERIPDASPIWVNHSVNLFTFGGERLVNLRPELDSLKQSDAKYEEGTLT